MNIICILVSTVFISIINPIQIVVVRLILCILVSLTLLINLLFSWISYRLILIVVGAVIVLFIYLTSLLPNSYNKNWYIIWFTPRGLIIDVQIRDSSYIPILKFPLVIILFISIYLLMAVIIATSKIMLNKGPIRGKN